MRFEHRVRREGLGLTGVDDTLVLALRAASECPEPSVDPTRQANEW